MNDNAPQAPSPEDLAELLPQYAIDSFIAQGGMGAVYKGRQVSLDRDVAIKVLLHEFGGDTKFLESFATEAKAMAQLSHSNLLGVFDFGDVEGMPYIVMEYGEGGTLHDAAWNKVIDAIQATEIVKGICAGLAHAHEHGIVHRDIKPANILLTQKAVPKVGDFGLAQANNSDQSGLLMGTPGYTAPEVFNNPDQAGELADIYSVGVILHQLLTGIDPSGVLEPPTKPTGNLHLDAIWRKATHITPAQRYASVEEMGLALEKWSSAKQKVLVTVDDAPFKSSNQAVQSSKAFVPVKSGSMGVKLVLITALVAAIVIVYQLASNKEKRSDEALANANGIRNIDTPVPVVEGNSGSNPSPKQPDNTTPLPKSELETVVEPIDKSVIASPKLEPEVGAIRPIDKLVIPTPEPEVNIDLLPGDPELRKRAITYILTARKNRDKDLEKNVRPLLSQLSSHTRKIKKDEVEFLERLKEDVVGNRIPLTNDVTGLPDKLVKSFERARSKEAAIDKAYLSRLTAIRDAYAPRLKKAATETSDTELKARLLAQAERAKNLEVWIEQLSPEPKWVRKKSSGFFGAGDFAGNWDHHAYNQISRQIAHPNGRFEIVGKKWEVTWKILKNGSLEVVWGNREKVFTYTRDGNGWKGTNQTGVKSALTRGDW